MKIALTGATGFVGNFIVPELLAVKHKIKALARQPAALCNQGLEVIKGDLADETALAKLVENVDVVIHVAGAISERNRAGYFAANLAGTKRLYDASQKANCRRFIYVSSITAREPGLSHYAASKAAAEQFLLGQKGGPQVIIMRPSAIYGPGDRSTLPLLKTLQSHFAIVPGNAASRFSLIHARDFAQVVVSAAASNATGVLEVDDMAGGHTWQDLANANRAITGMPQKLIYAPKLLALTVATYAELVGSITTKPSITNRGKVTELYHQDWVARGQNWPRDNPIRLAEGLAETLRWYVEAGWLPNKFETVRKQA
jgi:nucleoside-diphosphate-sugar epimerase